MNAMKIYKITLSPKDWFFFGGASTFDNGIKSSYIAHSDKIPQQTTLLGLMRYLVLKNEELLFSEVSQPKQDRIDKAIGEMSFLLGQKDQKFGQIIKLSPVFLERKSDSKAFFPVPLAYNYKLSFEEADIYMNGEVKKQLISDNNTFKEKDYCNFQKFYDCEGCVIGEEDIFLTNMQIGITKNTDIEKEENEKEKGFFKHEMVRFKDDDFCFAFFVKLTDDAKDLKDDFVYLGAERSCFKMKVDKLTNVNDLKQCFFTLHPSKPEKGRIVLLSPTYIGDMDELNSLCDFHWSFITPFRNLAFAKDGKGKLNSGKISYHRGYISYNLLCVGSVLFFHEKNREKIEKLLNDEHMQTIGYNYFDSMNNK